MAFADGVKFDAGFQDDFVFHYFVPKSSLSNFPPPDEYATMALNEKTVDKVIQSIAHLESEGLTEKDCSDSRGMSFAAAASFLLEFLESLIETPNVCRLSPNRSIFIRIIRPSFLTKLFELRRISNQLAASGSSSDTNELGFVSWVDIVIARLGEAIHAISGQGSSSPPQNSTDPEELNLCIFMKSERQKEKATYVASQLPATWSGVVSTIGSEHVSHAARRLALSLVFGAYILCPELSCEPGKETIATSDFLLLQKSLSKYLAKISSGLHDCNEVSSVTTTNLRVLYTNPIGKSQYAMLIGLYALELSQPCQSYAYRPCTLGTLFALIDLLMSDYPAGTAATPYRQESFLEVVTKNQCRLLAWGLIVPWCWMTWGTNVDVNFVTVQRLTATWLYHFVANDRDIERVLHFDPLGAIKVFSSLIVYPAPEAPNGPGSAILYKACWAISYITRHYQNLLNDSILITVIRKLLPLLFHRGEDIIDSSVQEVIVEMITCLPLQLTDEALKANFLEFTWFLALVNSTIGYIREFTDVTPDRYHTKHFKSSLDALIILASSGAPGPLMKTGGEDIATHLCSILGSKSPWCSTIQASAMLLLSYLARIRPNSKHLKHSFASCASMISYTQSDDLVMAAALAVNIHAEAKPSITVPLTLVEIWDYLRDVMLIIMGSQQTDCIHSLASSIRNTICSALSIVLACMSDDHTSTVLDSPWTMTLYNELRRHFPEQSPIDMLLTQIDDAAKGTFDPHLSALQLSGLSLRLVVHRREHEFNLIGIVVE